MKKDYSILAILLSTVFCACAIGISFIYLNSFIAFYIASAIISGIATIVCIVCLILRLKKYNGQESCYKKLTIVSMMSTSTVLLLIVIGTLTIMFM